ncbi:SDR family oxidoreductase [Algivirga pacifica]|uniref:SDR family oxidoreductase n=1 Tax=Algivirga pacifica TaxID=1162670 RepID=A0ABP9DIS7_9BACT
MMHTEPMLRDNALKSKTILVTGGGTGLGKSMAKYFLTLGAKVVICSRREEVLNATAEELTKETGGEVLPLTCDVRDYTQVESLIENVHQQWGRIDGLVNNAAGNFISPTEALSHKAFDVVVGIVLQGSYNFTLAMGKYWIKEKIEGTILNIVTTYSWTGSGYVVPSACAKAGVLALTRSLAVEWAKYGIRSNAIAPGPFPTKGAWDRLFPENIQHLFDPKERIPLKRVGDHQELANLAAYLMSPFSSYVNGEVITIDGGEWLKGAGEFNQLDEVDQETWMEVAKTIRANKKKSDN